ncbi:YXWGXW repeat-containing protein [Flavobacterium granuli]|uniref:YXWGXW repeat-containing protein n=1 Tax=Flavobacterium granuli TaxID=280093 RepID=A0A1M5T2Z6_9FLAO|nr:YXWGXW repeat-containing protein [Flavobacterium granuli]PRZ20666.1 YXWGXW repeat-containing protein [Flavobacterium granuli]SHH44723.1 YXWGXW repeat-containing protein [Flavobacterium granuli]
MKKFLLLILLGGFTLLVNSCAGYVSEQPAYVQLDITPRPYPNYIWIEGGWRWDNSRKNYIQKKGYWANPNTVRNHKNGEWRKYDRGYRWEKRRR